MTSSAKSDVLNSTLKFTIILLLLALNLPDPRAVNFFAIANTQFVSLSVIQLLLIFSSFLIILFIVRDAANLKISYLDLFVIAIATIPLLNNSNFPTIIIRFIFNIIPYFLGKLVFLNNETKMIVRILYIVGIIQAFLVISDAHFISLNISQVEGDDFFRLMPNGFNNIPRALGTIGHPLVLAVFLLIPAIISLYLLLSKSYSVMTLILFLATLYAIFLTFTRSTWITLAVIILYMLIKFNMFKNIKSIALTIFGFMAILFSPIFQNIVDRMTITTMEDGSVFHRLEMIGWVFTHMFYNFRIFLIGNGIGNTGTFLRLNPPSTLFFTIDNNFLSFLFEFGIIGFLLLSIILLQIIFKTRTLKVMELDVLKVILLALIANSMFFSLFSWYQTAIPFWLILGCLSTYITNSRIKKERLYEK